MVKQKLLAAVLTIQNCSYRSVMMMMMMMMMVMVVVSNCVVMLTGSHNRELLIDQILRCYSGDDLCHVKCDAMGSS